ncbi:MAG: PorV/PorQ family protein [Candidatus Kryptonium sp.]
MNRIILKVCIVLILGISISLAQIGSSLTKTGTTSAQFLKIGIGARAIGMGGAFNSIADDISAIYWNPAGLSRIVGRGEATFNYVDWLMDIKYSFAAFALNLGNLGTIGMQISSLTMGEMEVRTVEMPDGTGERFKAGGLMMGISYSRQLTDRFAIGFNAKYVREYIWHEVAQGFALDFGTLYVTPFLNGMRIGASMSNYGTKMQLTGRDLIIIYTVGGGTGNNINAFIQTDKFEMPLIFRVGLSNDFIKTESQRLTTAIDAIHPNDNTEYVNLGVEYSFKEIFFLRGGYKSLFEKGGEQRYTFGAGIRYALAKGVAFVVDYAYLDFGRLKNVQYITLSVKF